MNVLFDERLCERDFKLSAVGRDELRKWASDRSIVIPTTVPPIEGFDVLHLETLLCAIEHGAGQLVTQSARQPQRSRRRAIAAERVVCDLARDIRTDHRVAEMAADDPAVAKWLIGADVHRQWRRILVQAIEQCELCPIDALTGLPLAPRPAPTDLGKKWTPERIAEARARAAGYLSEGTAAPSTARGSESRDERRRRRLDRLQALGGDRSLKPGGGWKASGTRGALAALAREEADAGRPYSDERDVRRDLDAEAERRRAGRTMPRG